MLNGRENAYFLLEKLKYKFNHFLRIQFKILNHRSSPSSRFWKCNKANAHTRLRNTFTSSQNIIDWYEYFNLAD